MSISGRHRSHPSCMRAQISQTFLQFSERCPAGRRSFSLPPSKVIYQLYPTANVFAQLIYQFIKQRYRHFFTRCIQHYTVNFAKSYKTIAILEVLPHSLGPFLCNLSNYADCIFFAPSLFISAMPSNRRKSREQYLFVFVRITSIYIFLFPIPFVIIFVYNEPCAERPARCF